MRERGLLDGSWQLVVVSWSQVYNEFGAGKGGGSRGYSL